MEEKFIKLLAEALGVDEDVIKPESRFTEDLKANSLDILDMLVTLEEEYQVIVRDEEIKDLKTVQDVIDYINK